MDIFEKQHNGMLYVPTDETIVREQAKYLELLYDYNHTRPSQQEERTAMLREMLAEIGENSYIEPPFRANWGGHFLHFGKNVYANFNLTIVDDTHIYVGDNTMFGPNVMITTAGHPILPELRGEEAYQFNMPVTIGQNCWIGANVSIMPGVTIGDHTVIGAGSVVTQDIPADVVAMGAPCRVIRQINEHDKEYYYKDRKIDWDSIDR